MLTSRAKRRPAEVRPRRRGPDLRTAILDVARRLCFAAGVEGVSARKIAQAVGCSPTAIYLYYRNLDDVLHHLRMEGHALLADAFGRVDAALPPRERLAGMGRAYFRFGLAQPKYYELMFLAPFRDTPAHEFTQREIFTLTMVEVVVREGVSRGEIRADLDPALLAHGLWSQMHGLTALAVAGLLRETAPGREEDLLEAVLDGVDRWVRP